MSMKNFNNGNGQETNSSKNVAPATSRKEKTPTGHFRYNGKLYQMTFGNLPKEKIWCGYCTAHSAKVIGLIKVEDTYLLVIKCPFHGSYTMDLLSFKMKFPLVILPDELNKLLSPEGYPVQRSYCRECRGTTGKIIGETEDGKRWLIECETEGCKQAWSESKVSFRRKYIGEGNTPPMYEQTAPKIKMMENLGKSTGKTEEGTLAKALSGFVPAKKVDNTSPKQDPKPSEQPEASKPSTPEGISIEIPEGKTPCVKYQEGYLVISFH